MLFKFKESTTEEEYQLLSEGLHSLTSVEGVISVNCGKTTDPFYSGYSPRHQGYTYCLVVVLRDADALEGYDKSEFHGEVRNRCIIPLLDKSKDAPVLAVDVNGCSF